MIFKNVFIIKSTKLQTLQLKEFTLDIINKTHVLERARYYTGAV